MPDYDFRAPRLFVDAALSAGATVPLERNQSNYLGNVLRLVAGDAVLLFNGRDGEWRAEIGGRKRPDILTVKEASTNRRGARKSSSGMIKVPFPGRF